MKRFPVFLLAAVLVIGPAIIIGCSDDDEDQITGPTPGDPNDPEFLMVSDILGEGFLDHDYNILGLSLLMMEYVPSKGSGKNPFKYDKAAQYIDSLDYTYSYSDFWHTFTLYVRMVEGDLIASDTIIYTGVDSMRFRNPLGPVADPDSATMLDVHAHLDAELLMMDGYSVLSSHVQYVVTAVSMQGLVIDGTSSDTLDGYFSEADTACTVSMTTSQTAADVLINPYSAYDCPMSGIISVGAALDIGCVADTASWDFSGSWTARFVFNDGQITATYTSGNNVWTVTIPCETQITAVLNRRF